MPHYNSITILSSFLVASCSAVRLYSAHSDGNVSSLSLTETAGSYTLEVTSRTDECETNPSILTLDSDSRVIYCYNRGGTTDTVGSLSSFSISDTDGSLTRTSRVDAPYSGVWGEILTTENNRTYISAS